MFDISDEHLDAYKTPSRQITGSVICTTDDSTINITPDGSLIKFTIEKTAPEGKFFGFAISQKITIEALGIIEGIKKGNKLSPIVGVKGYESEFVDLPYFYVDTVDFNKVTNTTTITGYDFLHKTDNISIGSLGDIFSYPIYASSYVRKIIETLGGYVLFDGIDHLMRETPNLEGTETIRSVLTSFAEFTGTICYVSHHNTVKFRSLQQELTDVLTADDYINLSNGENTMLTQVANTTQLGDNITVGSEGHTQVLWDNPFLNTRDDAATILETIGSKVIGLMNTDYTLEWRGCPAYELGDFVILQDKDNSAQYVFYFNEVLEYNGGLKATSEWKAGESENIEAPTTLSGALNQTSAKVDKVKQEIELIVGKTEGLETDVANLKITTEGIESTVTSNTNGIAALEKKTSQSMTADEVEILVEEKVGNAGSEVKTSTGFTFDKDGLTIAKSGSSIETQITEDGMTVSRIGDNVLVANNEGVMATNLHATTYLILGTTSRFEDYENGFRTACFWIGTKTAEEV